MQAPDIHGPYTAAIRKHLLPDGTASCFMSNGWRPCFLYLHGQIQRRGKAAPEPSLTLIKHDAMKALTIPASRPSMRGCMRSISATVSNLRARFDGNFADFRGIFAEKLAQSGFFSELCNANTNDSVSVPRSIGHCSRHIGRFLCPHISGGTVSLHTSQSYTAAIRHSMLPDGTASFVLATDGSRACFCPDASIRGEQGNPYLLPFANTNDAMKALQIQTPARISFRATLRQLCATVSNLRTRIDARALLATALTAIVCLFACLGAMYIPGIIISGLTALMAVALAPSVKEGGAV